ncbi:hypothetical protein F5B20DRAFT_462791 [Whalleya microplaca]|nr:hypothetical protein F5B20DRAFT_462791 [Whalleya microplaca]
MDSVNKDGQLPKVSFCDDGGRPKINEYSSVPKFRPNDHVYLQPAGTATKEGPYIVSSVSDKKYTLRDTNGNAIQSGIAFSEDDLKMKDPFE